MVNITLEFARRFAEEWTAAWNSHDLEKILSHYSDDFTIQSRIAARLVPESKGFVAGKQAVREYWTIGLSKNPNLEFKILDVLIGVNSLTVYYVNLANYLRGVEMMAFNEKGKVEKVIAHHSE
jgi:ketosteroid isomerase-like protein